LEILESKTKNFTIAVLLVLLLGIVSYADAQQNSKDGYGTGAYSELGADETYLERASDWFAIVGKTKEEKALIKSQRRAARKISNSRKMIIQKKKEIEKKKRNAMRELKERENN
jgi:hypothetical protein